MERSLHESLKKVLSIVRGVYVSGVGVELSWGSDKPLLTQIFTAIDKVAEEHSLKVIVVFDELQRAVRSVGLAIQNAIAYSYDHLKNISFIINGSEMGGYRIPIPKRPRITTLRKSIPRG